MTGQERLTLKRLVDKTRRDRLERERRKHQPADCQVCGDVLVIPHNRTRKLYCSDHCRRDAATRGSTRPRRVELEPVGNAILKARRGLGLTQRQTASRLGVGRETFRSWEQGRSCPSVPVAERLEQVLGVSAAFCAEFRLNNRGLAPSPALRAAAKREATSLKEAA